MARKSFAKYMSFTLSTWGLQASEGSWASQGFRRAHSLVQHGGGNLKDGAKPVRLRRNRGHVGDAVRQTQRGQAEVRPEALQTQDGRRVRAEVLPHVRRHVFLLPVRRRLLCSAPVGRQHWAGGRAGVAAFACKGCSRSRPLLVRPAGAIFSPASRQRLLPTDLQGSQHFNSSLAVSSAVGNCCHQAYST